MFMPRLLGDRGTPMLWGAGELRLGDEPGDQPVQDRREASPRRRGRLGDLIVGERDGRDPGSEVRHQRDGCHLDAHVPQGDRLRHRRHADEVGADPLRHLHLGRCLVARAEEPRIDPFPVRHAYGGEVLGDLGTEARRIGGREIGEARAEPRVVVPEQRVAAGEVDVVADHHQVAGCQPVADAAGNRLRITLEFAGRTILLRAWKVEVGRTKLYLLDSNDPFNTPADRGLTAALYGGDAEVRLLQEIILGVGGWRLVEALGLDIEICHLNEGHAALAVVERARQFMQQRGTTFREAFWATRAGNVFTTHTPVAAAFDTYRIALLAKYGGLYATRLGVEPAQLLELARSPAHRGEERFNMAF
ncbi:MAG: alpha-glucan family phosphorylase, partial [Actinobacteria bacterium]